MKPIPEREQLEQAYFKLANLLAKEHPNLNYENHCYWRMANDAVCYNKWDRVVKAPFYKNASDNLLADSLDRLRCMLYNYDYINSLNKLSLTYRGKTIKNDIDYIDNLTTKQKIDNMKTNEQLFESQYEEEVVSNKQLRKDIDDIIQRVKALPASRERSLAITKLQEGVMWLGMDLKRLGEVNPYPSSKDPSTGLKIESTADDLQL